MTESIEGIWRGFKDDTLVIIEFTSDGRFIFNGYDESGIIDGISIHPYEIADTQIILKDGSGISIDDERSIENLALAEKTLDFSLINDELILVVNTDAGEGHTIKCQRKDELVFTPDDFATRDQIEVSLVKSAICRLHRYAEFGNPEAFVSQCLGRHYAVTSRPKSKPSDVREWKFSEYYPDEDSMRINFATEMGEDNYKYTNKIEVLRVNLNGKVATAATKETGSFLSGNRSTEWEDIENSWTLVLEYSEWRVIGVLVMDDDVRQ